FCFLKPRALAATTVALLAGYWALMAFVPIRDIAMEKNAIAARVGVAKPTMEQAQKLFDETTTMVSGKFDMGLNLSNHLDLEYPVIKKSWTSSYVLVAGGWSMLLLGGFYYAVDIRHWRGWCAPFVWVGLNPITLYIISGLLSYQRLAARLTGGDLKSWLDAH